MSKCIYLIGKMAVACLLLMLPLFSLAQTSVTGKVISAKDQTVVPGVSVIIKGSTTGTATTVEGTFAIAAKSGDVLVFSGVGLVSKEIEVGSNHVLEVAIETDARSMNEVVVTALGIKKEK